MPHARTAATVAATAETTPSPNAFLHAVAAAWSEVGLAGGDDQPLVAVLVDCGERAPVGDPVRADVVGSGEGCDNDATCALEAHPTSAAAMTEPTNKRRITTDTSRSPV
jgi:hypothetical protein